MDEFILKAVNTVLISGEGHKTLLCDTGSRYLPGRSAYYQRC